MRRIDQDTIDRVITFHLEGKKSREIGELLGRGKSTVNDILTRWREEEEHSKEGDLEESKLDSMCNSESFDISNLAKRLRTAQRTNNQLRQIQRGHIDQGCNFSKMLEGVTLATKKLNKIKTSSKNLRVKSKKSTPAIMEILFSDLQIGKIGQYYNTEIAIAELKNYGEQLLSLIEERKSTYSLEKIVFASLGDIVEDHLKHGVQSAVSTDSGLSEQISNAISSIWTYVIRPLAGLGIPMEIIGIAGNHGSSEHKGMDMYKAGLYSYDYIIYKTLEGYCKVAGFENVKFFIPEGVFGFTEIYGRYAIYEHGYFNSATEKSMEDQMKKRGQQIKKHVEYFRCGDMHHLCSYDNHKMVLNGAFFGTDNKGLEYSGILGFNSIPSQAVMFHIDERSIGKNTVKEFISIQVAKGY